jgi:hypothetical protein
MEEDILEKMKNQPMPQSNPQGLLSPKNTNLKAPYDQTASSQFEPEPIFLGNRTL